MSERNAICKEFHGRHGKVVLFINNGKYFVRVERMDSDGMPSVKQFGNLDYHGGNVLYEMLMHSVQSRISRVSIPCRCAYKPDENIACNAQNCPTSVGDAAFWEMFGNYCKYKVR